MNITRFHSSLKEENKGNIIEYEGGIKQKTI